MSKPRGRKRDTAVGLGVYDAERDILDLYLHEVSQSALLFPTQEIAVARWAQKGDDEAIHELATRNLRFVISVAKRYQNRGLPHGRTIRVPLNRTADLSRVVKSSELRLHAPLAADGDRFGITRERVRQLRDRALKKLREGEVSRSLASYAA